MKRFRDKHSHPMMVQAFCVRKVFTVSREGRSFLLPKVEFTVILISDCNVEQFLM